VVASKLRRGRATFFIAKPNRDDLDVLRGLIGAGEVRPVIEERYELDRIDEAMRGFDGHARAKIVVTV
jgi:hypothetical protein